MTIDEQSTMSVQALIESERVQRSTDRRKRGMDPRERRGELLLAIVFALASGALLASGGVEGHVSPTIILLYVLGVAAAGHVRFDIGAGFTVPTQVVFVPMLFAIPVALVPPLVALALALGMLPGILDGRLSPSRLLAVPGNSWFALGPAAVLLAAHVHGPEGALWALTLALLAQFACDFVANALREVLRKEITLGELVEETRKIYLVDLALTPLGLAIAYATPGHPWALLLIAPVFGVLAVLSRERRARMAQLVELNQAYRGTALVLSDVVEADDSYTGEHCWGVVRLALEVAKELDLDADRQRNVEFGALLHDVGKIAVPNEIINKPGALDDSEWAIIRTHTIEGQKILEQVGGFMGEVGQIVRFSHERWDGKGYPDGLRGEEIPLEARIVSTCDAFNAMTTTRSYRRAMSFHDAIAELAGNAGTQFDPHVVEILIRLALEPRSSEDARAGTLTAVSIPKDPVQGAEARLQGPAPTAPAQIGGLSGVRAA
jgi:putative nucleotidyltransferase with HDIG domain